MSSSNANPNPFPPTFSSNISTSSSSSSSSLPGIEKFAFSAGESSVSTERRRTTAKRPMSASTHNKPPSSSSSSSSFSFQKPFIFFENADKKETPDETKANAKTRFNVLSAVTGTIPCYFEGSAYTSRESLPLETSCFATDESNTNDRDESCVQNPSASQIMVSRLLKGIPQSPHFWPLRGYSEAAKQSLINSWDRIFEESADQIQSLQFIGGFSIVAKRLWETAQELQMMGYNVVPLRRRLVELSNVVHQRARHRVEKMRLESNATQHMMEEKKLEFEIVKLKAKIEAEKASFDEVMCKVAKMEEEMLSFNAFFSKLAIKPL